MIGDDKVAEVRERTDIVVLIGEYVPLRRVGAQFKGLCPFHAEKSPSFYVHPARQFFHCFGCQASGDSIAFVMRAEGITFPEAIRRLAEKSGVELPEEDPREEIAVRRARLERDRLVAVMDAAAGFYVHALREHPNAHLARAELEARGVTHETATTFRLGYAPSGWDELGRFLADKGFAPRDAEAVGLLVPRKSGDGHYDRFRHRLMFPVSDVHGRIVAFSGRALPPLPNEPLREGQDKPAKYINSPESPLYHKGDVLFGLHEGRVELRRTGQALVCEGNFDVLALHQADFKNVVAPLGTALTPAHAKLLRRYASSAILVFDGDAAGAKAVRSSFPLLVAEAIQVKVGVLPPGEDPDSLVRKRGPEALQSLVAAAPPAIDYLVDTASYEAAGDPAAKAAAIEALGPILASVQNPVEARLYLERVARAFQISDLQAVRQQLIRGVRAARAGRGGRQQPREERQPMKAEVRPKQTIPYPPLEEEIVGAILDHPALLQSSEIKNVLDLLTSADLRGILRDATRMVGSRSVTDVALDAAALIAQVGEGPARAWLEERLAVQKFDAAGATELLDRAVPHLRRKRIERELSELSDEVKRARMQGDHARADELMRRHMELFSRSAPPKSSS